jgi:hypothetical protein
VLIVLAASAALAQPVSAQIRSGQLYNIQHASTARAADGFTTVRYVDAHVTPDQDYRIVTRLRQENDTQLWRLTALGGDDYMISSLSNGRYWDAHVTEDRDYELVTRPRQENDTQRWRVIAQSDGTYTIMQVSTGRFVDAYDTAEADFRVVTRPRQDNDTQRWYITPYLGGGEVVNCLPFVNFCF